MIDTRCWKCMKDSEIFDIESNNRFDIVDRTYQGNGKFKCPRCGDVLNLSDNTYHTIISIDIHGWVMVLKTDVKRDGLEQFTEDISELTNFKPKDAGVYDCDIYWRYYHCGGYDEPNEWDVDIRFFKMNPVQIQFHERPRSWVKRSEAQKQAIELLRT